MDTYRDFIKTIASVLSLFESKLISSVLGYQINNHYICNSNFCKLSAKKEEKIASSKYLK